MSRFPAGLVGVVVGFGVLTSVSGCTDLPTTETCHMEYVGSTVTISVEGVNAKKECTEIANSDPSIYVIGNAGQGSVICEVEVEGYRFMVRDTRIGGSEGAFMCRWLNSWK